MQRRILLKPDSPLGWLMAACFLVIGVAVAAVAFTVFLVLIGVAALVAPVYLWWRKRKALGGRARRHGNVIDVEYQVHPNLPGEQRKASRE